MDKNIDRIEFNLGSDLVDNVNLVSIRRGDRIYVEGGYLEVKTLKPFKVLFVYKWQEKEYDGIKAKQFAILKYNYNVLMVKIQQVFYGE